MNTFCNTYTFKFILKYPVTENLIIVNELT